MSSPIGARQSHPSKSVAVMKQAKGPLMFEMNVEMDHH